jgi:hypothetical protein
MRQGTCSVQESRQHGIRPFRSGHLSASPSIGRCVPSSMLGVAAPAERRTPHRRSARSAMLHRSICPNGECVAGRFRALRPLYTRHPSLAAHVAHVHARVRARVRVRVHLHRAEATSGRACRACRWAATGCRQPSVPLQESSVQGARAERRCLHGDVTPMPTSPVASRCGRDPLRSDPLRDMFPENATADQDTTRAGTQKMPWVQVTLQLIG